MKISAVIFDLDGTVLDNEDEYGLAFKKVLESLGARVDTNYPHVGGIGVKENWPGLIKKYHLKTKKSYNELASETQREYLELLPRVRMKKGVEKFIKGLRESGIKTALATSNVWFILEKVFEELPIEGLFDSLTTGEEVSNKKPAPDLFLAAVDKLDVRPEECLVIEDSTSGIKAARESGMKVIAIARDNSHAKDLEGADLVIRSYNQLTPTALWRI
ncbi:MAG: HAD family hydrolase [Patescibacteria group bacterium]